MIKPGSSLPAFLAGAAAGAGLAAAAIGMGLLRPRPAPPAAAPAPPPSVYNAAAAIRPAPDPGWAALRDDLARLLTNGVQGRYGLYLEDLRTGASLGIREREAFRPWSQLKVCVLVAALKAVQDGRLSLANPPPLPPAESGPSAGLPLLTHMERMIGESDNQASFALARCFTAEEFQETLMALGLPSAPPGKPKTHLPDITPKAFANVLRSLAAAAYLRKPYADLALALLSDTIFNTQLRAGLPPDVALAHSVGYNAESGDFSDSGIVYLPGAPYLLCLMGAGSTREESERVMSEASRLVYERLRTLTGGAE